MKATFQSALLTGLAAALVGCASGYQQFYQPVPGVTPELIAARRAAPAPALPMVERSQPRNDQALLDAYLKRGYNPIGHVGFTSGRPESDAAALQQARDVGADLVLIFDPRFAGSTTTNIPITVPTTNTAYTTSSATAYGAGGTVRAYGNSTTTTYGSTTNVIPITVNRSSYGAIFFVKTKSHLGLVVRDLDDSERRALQTNKGVVVRVVVDGTPAFDADLLVGDIITAIDGQVVGTSTTFTTLASERKGKTVSIKFIRGTQTMEKSVSIGV